MGFNSPNSPSTTQGFCSGNNDTMMAFSSANSSSPTQGFSTGGSTSTTLFGISSPSPVPLFGSPSPATLFGSVPSSSGTFFGTLSSSSPSPFTSPSFGSGPSSSGSFFAANNGTLPSSSPSPFTSPLFGSSSSGSPFAANNGTRPSSSPSPFTSPLFGSSSSGSFFAANNGTLPSSSASPFTSPAAFSFNFPSKTNFDVPGSSSPTSSTATTTPAPPFSGLFTYSPTPPATSTASAAPRFNFASAPATWLCERCGHKVAAYTPSHDENAAGKIESISAMSTFKDKSHEELRWSVYQSQGWNKGFHKRVPINASTTTAQPPVVIIPVMAFPVMPNYNFYGLGTSPWTPIWGVAGPSANGTLFGQGNSSGTAVCPGVASLCNMFRHCQL